MGDNPTLAYDVTRPEFAGVPGPTGGDVTYTEFDRTGATVYETFVNRTLRHWDPRTGDVLGTWQAVGNGRPSVAADGRTVLVPDLSSATGVLLDSGTRGELGQLQTCPGFTLHGSLEVRGDLAAFGEFCGGLDAGIGTIQIVDLRQRTLLASLPGWFAQDLAISPDGKSFVSQEWSTRDIEGPLKVADLQTGSLVVELTDVCRWDNSVTNQNRPDQQPGCHPYPQTPFPFLIAAGGAKWSPDGRMIAAIGQHDVGLDAELVVWDAHDGHVLYKRPTDPKIKINVGQITFTPDSKRLVVSYNTGVVEALSADTWTTVTTTQLDASAFPVGQLGFVGFTPDGSTILAIAGFGPSENASLLWLDAETLQIKGLPAPVPDLHSGFAVFESALSPDGSLMATGGAVDGIVRIWDTRTGERKQQMDFGELRVQGIAFVDNGHLAVTPQGGGLLIMTVDPAELAATVRASLTRTFTAEECTTYGIDPCPTLEQMRTP